MKSLLTTFFALLFLSFTIARECQRGDYQRLLLPCDQTRKRSVVYYLKPTAECEMKNPPLPVKGIPCECAPGYGLNERSTCTRCPAGQFGAGGETFQDWKNWNSTGIPGMGMGFVTSCDFYSSYKRKCAPWTASDDFQSINSGENQESSCIHSSLVLQKRFVGDINQVVFQYRVDGGKCYSRYSACDGLGFFIDDVMVMKFVTFKYKWTKAVFHTTAGQHKLRWVFRKKCYGSSKFSKVHIRSITLVGSEEPNSGCQSCPPGTFSSTEGSKSCEKCTFFKFQSKSGNTSCEDCPEGQYSLPGEAACKPLPPCTKDHIIQELEPLNQCRKKGTQYMRTIKSQYTKPPGQNKPLCNVTSKGKLDDEEVPCRCQPGQTLNTGAAGKIFCSKCPMGSYSNGSAPCKQCSDGKVAVPGKHFIQWVKGQLPDGLKSECVGDDCIDKVGWLPSTDRLRTGRILGSIDASLTTRLYKLTSNVSNVTFYCTIMCNVSEPTSVAGAHLASAEDCFLQAIIEKDGEVYQSQNCTAPKHIYRYRNSDNRDGRVFKHQYSLPPGNYTFRWHYHQVDPDKSTSAGFSASVFNISIVGMDDGEAMECYTCPAGFYSKGISKNCEICPNGTYSLPGSSQCTPCPDGKFADKPGSPVCLPCGENTKSSKNRDSCETGGCTFIPRPGILYDLNALSRPGDQMFEYVPDYFNHPHPHRYGRYRPGSVYYPRRRQRFYFNFCTLEHDNSSCTTWKDGKRVILPTMACSSYPWGSDQDLGKVIGFKPKTTNTTGGFIVELTHGGRCYLSGVPGRRTTISTQVEMVCDLSAGLGLPDRHSNTTQPRVNACQYKFRWHSMYGCPKCLPENYILTQTACENGFMNTTYVKKFPCWGTVDGKADVISRVKCASAAASTSDAKGVNKMLIGLGVFFVLLLLIIIVYYVHKNRTLTSNYYKLLSKQDPTIMSELQGVVEDDDYQMDYKRGKFK